jgi:Ca2+-binding RTX toxin-like protein
MRNSSSTNRHKRMMETLEQRRMMSASLVSGVLTVTGTVGADRLEVDQTASDVYVFENGLLTRLFPTASVSRVVLRGLDGNDVLKVWPAVSKPTDMHGDNGNDSIYGNDFPQYVNAANGDDYVSTAGGNDSVSGGEGNDWIFTGFGNDFISGVGGADYIGAGNGHDTVYGGEGNDSIWGEADNDIIRGDGGNDYIACSTGNDTVYAGWGNDKVYGESGNDILFGEDGYDTLNGGAGADQMFGGNHNDFFQAFDDVTDWIDGGAGSDTAHCDKRPWYAPWQTKDNLTSIESSYE